MLMKQVEDIDFGRYIRNELEKEKSHDLDVMRNYYYLNMKTLIGENFGMIDFRNRGINIDTTLDALECPSCMTTTREEV